MNIYKLPENVVASGVKHLFWQVIYCLTFPPFTTNNRAGNKHSIAYFSHSNPFTFVSTTCIDI